LGCVITNFSKPDTSKKDIEKEYSDLIAEYLYHKNDFFQNIKCEEKTLEDIVECLNKCSAMVSAEFDYYYSEFITRLIMDISSTIVPTQKFVNSFFINNVFSPESLKEILKCDEYRFSGYKEIKNNPVYSFLYLSELMGKGKSRYKRFINELSSASNNKIDLLKSFSIRNAMIEKSYLVNGEINELKEKFNENNIYQFLDKPNERLFFDIILNQMAFPYHYNTEKIERFQYKAKQNSMFTDIVFLDECRYLYEWLPTIDLIHNMFDDVEWQYTYRFILDGLIKHRIKYNTDYFFSCSVISKKNDRFGAKILKERVQWGKKNGYYNK